jgi:hypothetical protein
MARYYFHLCDGSDLLLDEEGRDLEAGQIAGAALAEARSIIAGDATTGHIYLDQRIEVHDPGGKLVHCLSFEDAVQVTHQAVSNR